MIDILVTGVVAVAMITGTLVMIMILILLIKSFFEMLGGW